MIQLHFKLLSEADENDTLILSLAISLSYVIRPYMLIFSAVLGNLTGKSTAFIIHLFCKIFDLLLLASKEFA